MLWPDFRFVVPANFIVAASDRTEFARRPRRITTEIIVTNGPRTPNIG